MIPKTAKAIETGIAKIIEDERTACVTLAFPIPRARIYKIKAKNIGNEFYLSNIITCIFPG